MNMLIGFFAVIGIFLAVRVVFRGIEERAKEQEEFDQWRHSKNKSTEDDD